MKYRAGLPVAAFLLAALPITASIILDNSRSRPVQKLSRSVDMEKEAVAFDEPAEADEFFLLKRSPDGHPIQIQRYLDAIEHMKRMPQYSTADRTRLPSLGEMQAAGVGPQALGAWTPLGPGNVGGRTRALLINHTNSSVMYAAGVGGGVWKPQMPASPDPLPTY
jgi:hypothetical protein